MERGGRKMRETGDKAKRKKGEGRKESRERERRRGVGEDYPLSSPSQIQGQFLSFWNHKCTSHSHPCHLKINILFRFQFRDCEGNTLQLYQYGSDSRKRRVLSEFNGPTYLTADILQIDQVYIILSFKPCRRIFPWCIFLLSPVYTMQVLHPSLHSSFLIVYTIQET